MSEHDCGDPNCDGLAEPPVMIRSIAKRIDPWEAQLAIAHAMVAMGASPEWDSETIEHVAYPMIAIGKKAGLPTFISNDDEATEFWESVRI